MEKIINIIALQNVLPRPLGHIRYGIFLLSFLISRIPVWFIVFSAFLYNGVLNALQTVVISFFILICRTFIESELAGGRSAFYFFAGMRCIRILYYIFIIILIIFGLCCLLIPYGNTTNYTLGTISIIAALICIVFFSGCKESKNTYLYGYKTKRVLSVILSFLWFYLGFIPDAVYINIIVITAIYSIEFYNLIYNKPLGIMPNQTSLNM